MKLPGFILLLVVLGIILYFALKLTNVKRNQMQKRIEQIKKRKISTPHSLQDVSLRRKINEPKGLIYWLTKPLPDFKSLGFRLERAGKDITPKQYVVRLGLITLAIIFFMALFLKKPLWLALGLGFFGGIFVPLQLLQFAVSKHSKAFLRVFPDAIDLIVRGLRSGLPVSESLVMVSQEVQEPVGGIFGNVTNTMKLGVTMEKALQETAIKLDMTEFNFFTTSIVLQRETGGNLAEILNNLSEVLRSRYIMRMKIVALSSEARASAIIIGALPFVVLAAVSVLSPAYMSPLWNDPRGNICAGVAAGMMGLGMFTMYRMTQFEI